MTRSRARASVAEVMTDSAGRFLFRGVSPGFTALQVALGEADAKGEEPFEAEAGKTHAVRLTFTRQ